MTNALRGEIEYEYQGQKLFFCLTMQSLAEIETHLNLNSFTEVFTNMQAGIFSARAMITILKSSLMDQSEANLHSIEQLPPDASISLVKQLVTHSFANMHKKKA